jgi:hypothetical protein
MSAADRHEQFRDSIRRLGDRLRRAERQPHEEPAAMPEQCPSRFRGTDRA